MHRIRKGDRIIVTTGRDKGRQGTVIRVTDDEHVVIENVNMVKKHQKPNPQRGAQGGIVQKEAPIHVSNVALYNPLTDNWGELVLVAYTPADHALGGGREFAVAWWRPDAAPCRVLARRELAPARPHVDHTDREAALAGTLSPL